VSGENTDTIGLTSDTTDDDPPVVLAIDDDEKILETYGMWLSDAYDLRTATSGEEALDSLDSDVQVVLLDRLMPGLSGDEVLERIRERDVDCRVAMVTAVEPDFDIAEMPFDTYVTKALDRETVRETVAELVARAEYDTLLRRHYALAEKLATLEERKSESELATSEAYQELSAEFDALNEQLTDRTDEFVRDDFVRSLDTLDPAQVIESGSEPDDTEATDSPGDSP